MSLFKVFDVAGSAMNAQTLRLNLTASNMANAHTIGFRAEMIDQRPFTIEGDGLEVRAPQQAAVRGAKMEAGEFVRTGNDMDIAINGDALMAVQASARRRR